MAALNAGNVQRARDILDANEHLIDVSSLSSGLGGSTGISGE